jgi:hypothetical protein
MPLLNAEQMCTSIPEVIKHIKDHGTVLQTSMGIKHDLVKIMTEVENGGELKQTTIAALISLLQDNNDEISTVLYSVMLTRKRYYEVAYTRFKDRKSPFEETDSYKKVLANYEFLKKLFTKYDFLKTGEYSFISRAIAENEFKRRVIEWLLQYDKLGPWWEGELSSDQRFGYKDNEKYMLTTNETTWTINAYKVH